MKSSILFILLFASTLAFSQSPCWSDQLLSNQISTGKVDHAVHSAHSALVNYWRSQNPGPYAKYSYKNKMSGGSSCVEADYIIPVIVHVVHLPGRSIGAVENITDYQIRNQLAALNNAFASNSAGMQFELDTVYRHSSARYYQVSLHADSFDRIRQAYNVQEASYLNIYVVNEIFDDSLNSTTVGGFSSYPFTIGQEAQGIVMEYDKFGSFYTGSPILSSSQGELLVHEVGHYLGLYHPFKDSCLGSTYPSCKTMGDLCCDVAQSSQAITSCATAINSCTDSSDYDKLNNYMGYTQDACTDNFTNDQLGIMLATLQTYRSNLAHPLSINRLDLDSCYWSARFVAPSIICVGDSLYADAYNLGSGINYTWQYK